MDYGYGAWKLIQVVGAFVAREVWVGVFGGGGSSELLSGDRITPIYTPED